MEIQEPIFQTSKEREIEFLQDLEKLLKKHKATIEITDYDGSIETIVELQSEWSGGDWRVGDLTKEYTQFKLRKYLDPEGPLSY